MTKFLARYKTPLLYIFFGVATTLVYFVSRVLVYHLTWNLVASVITANLVAIIFAFVTNAKWVFVNEHTKSMKNQLILFFVARLASMGIDLLINQIGAWLSDTLIRTPLIKNFPYHLALIHKTFLVTVIGSPFLLNMFIWMIISQITIIILNYLFSKKIVFA